MDVGPTRAVLTRPESREKPSSYLALASLYQQHKGFCLYHGAGKGRIRFEFVEIFLFGLCVGRRMWMCRPTFFHRVTHGGLDGFVQPPNLSPLLKVSSFIQRLRAVARDVEVSQLSRFRLFSTTTFAKSPTEQCHQRSEPKYDMDR